MICATRAVNAGYFCRVGVLRSGDVAAGRNSRMHSTIANVALLEVDLNILARGVSFGADRHQKDLMF
jgi:hypothetical protein